jgi:hypothetical protein
MQCGGVYRLSLYSTSVTETGPPTPSYLALGCYEDDSARALQNVLKSDALMTPLLCGGFCQGFTYMGLEDSSQCMCGYSLPANYSKVANQECNSTCGGDTTTMCGGVWRLDLYLME